MNWKSIALLGLAMTLTAADKNTAALDSQHLRIGRDLYRENCSVCHDIDKDKLHSRKLGPSLNHLFKNEKLPLSHGKPNRPYVTLRIKFGGALMPAFGKRLSEEEIVTLVDYIASK
jgi:mono/diheme cytochrome c family protein